MGDWQLVSQLDLMDFRLPLGWTEPYCPKCQNSSRTMDKGDDPNLFQGQCSLWHLRVGSGECSPDVSSDICPGPVAVPLAAEQGRQF